jgi:hypothetical protein
MTRARLGVWPAVLAAFLLAICSLAASKAPEPAWTDDFSIAKADLASTGSNPYFILQPGYQLVLKDREDTLTITVLNETKVVDGVETRVVEEKETVRGRVAEVSRNYFAISKKNNTVFYFGEDTGGAWRAGVSGARAGVMMPGIALLGARYYQEVAPKVAMDRAEIVSISDTLMVPAGKFGKVLKIEETTPLEPGNKEYKYYAPGIGLLRDGGFVLVKHGYLTE